MTRPNSLQKLLALRHARLQRAEGALARQHAQCEAARGAVEAATASVLAHRDWQQDHERALLDDLLERTVTSRHIERLRAAFAQFDEHAASLERAEREADQAMRAAFELKHYLAVERRHRRREGDKMTALVAHARSAARRREELHAEAEQEERVHRSASSERPWPC
jgi:hypothetical protein